jgi:H+/Cl- antiporter ClcA/CBS domain-containing protein
MPEPEADPRSATTDGLTISPSLDLVAEATDVPQQSSRVDQRTVRLAALAIVLGVTAALAAVLLTRLIFFVTNLSFFGRFSIEAARPEQNHLGAFVVLVPIAGAILVGVMARFGSKAIRGHGIPEAMEQVLMNRSRIPARVTFLKPLSAALSIGTGGPFGAEGPIIATGGALGSVLGQFTTTTGAERRTLLAAGAAAGMAATFGSPVSAVLLAVELLLFEFRARSVVPVALATVAATGMRFAIEGHEPAFPMPHVDAPGLLALLFYVALGALTGLAAAGVTKLVYAIEDGFERLPIHWMWWPAIGAIAVGVVGYFAPRTLGVGYVNITDILSGNLTAQAVLFLCVMKFISWSISLGSGTSGGTLAPLMTIGGGFGASIGVLGAWLLPQFDIDPRIAALVGMAALFAGASRAVLTSVVFAYETTQQPFGLLPLLGGCTAAYFISCLVMRHTIMTEKIARRGIRAPAEYAADALDRLLVRMVASPKVVALKDTDRLDEIRAWIVSGSDGSRHQGFPVLNGNGHLVGVVTRKDIYSAAKDAAVSRVGDLIRRSPKFVYDDSTVRQAADHMVNHGVGRLPVVSREEPAKVVGIITRSDVLSSYRRQIEEEHLEPPTITFARLRKSRRGARRA